MDNNYTASSHPPKVEKGDRLTVEQLAPILNLPYPHEKWWRKLLHLKAKIQRDRENREMPPVTMTTKGDGLQVLTDAEAAEYNRRHGKNDLHRYGRRIRLNLAVDETKLTPEELEIHRRAVKRQALIYVAIRSARHAALPAPSGPVERVAPPMLQVAKTG